MESSQSKIDTSSERRRPTKQGSIERVLEAYLQFFHTLYAQVFHNFGSTALPFQQRSILVGLSCFMFMLPVPYATSKERYLWIAQSVLSFSSDFIYTGRYSISHGMDRIFASFMTLYCLVWAMLSFPGYTKLAVPFLLYFTTVCIVKSKRAANRRERHAYEFYHALWHFLAGLTCCLITLVKNGDEM